jgi:hypothetical protein
MRIATVHVVFKTHLDIGFTDLARNVRASYFERFIPAAVALARQVRESGGPQRFIWTTGSWVLYEYLEWACPSNRRLLERAIADGDIVWHALPCTTHSEFLGRDLFRFGLSLSQQLDRRFGRKTIAAKMTDVPGHTRAIVPLLAEAGVRFLHIGVNPACAPPQVPPVFRWRDQASGSEVMVMYHTNYGLETTVPGLPDAICFEHTGDNNGPPLLGNVLAGLHRLEKRFPGAAVHGSTLDAFARRLLTIRANLPVVTGEIGDTWIYGTGTDPQKVSQFRAAARLREQFLAQGKARPDDPRIQQASRCLLMVGEHTWGLDLKTHLADFTNYATSDMPKLRRLPNYRKMEASWQEQRDYLTSALTALSDHPLASAIRRAWSQAQPKRPSLRGFTRLDAGAWHDAGGWRLRFAADTGALIGLQAPGRRAPLASPSHPLALLTYQTFDQADYDRYLRQYARDIELHRGWIVPDITKPGIAAAGARQQTMTPRLQALYHRRHRGSDSFVAHLTLPRTCQVQYGAPSDWFLLVHTHDGQSAVELDLSWFGKRATRLPEAVWFSFRPPVRTPQAWTLDKAGAPISPLEVVPGGGRKLHAVWSGVRYAGPDGALTLETLDAPLVAPGRPALLRYDDHPLPLTGGMHFNLYNNLFDSNFPMWYDQDARFRFRLALV